MTMPSGNGVLKLQQSKMAKNNHRPELILIAGPNGSGKTTVTNQFLHHEWSGGAAGEFEEVDFAQLVHIEGY